MRTSRGVIGVMNAVHAQIFGNFDKLRRVVDKDTLLSWWSDSA
jgi:hypothetical protein